MIAVLGALAPGCQAPGEDVDGAFYDGDGRAVHCALGLDTVTRNSLASIDTALDRAAARGEVVELYAHDPGRTVYALISAEAFVAQFAATSKLPSSIEAASNYQLSAYLLMIDDEQRTRLVVLEDDRYIYPLRLDAASREHDLRFETCIASIRPIPAPAREISPALAFAWVD